MSAAEKFSTRTHFITIAAVDGEGVDPDKLVQLAKAALPSSHIISSSTIGAQVFDPEGLSSDTQRRYLPLTRSEVQDVTDEDGFMTVIVSVDQEAYMMAYAKGRQVEGADRHFDLLYREAFGFMAAVHSQAATIVAADENALLVHYSCRFENL